jgi:hypothetical protein
MRIREIFETPVEERIEPVIKVGDRQDDRKLAGEIRNYVVTPLLEKYLDDFLENYTDTFLQKTEEIGVWISGYFGSGKSHLAKIMAMLVENKVLDGTAACKRFESRVPLAAPRRESLLRSLTRVPNCQTRVLGFNLNTIADSKNTPLPRLLLSQFYQSKGYSANFLYARVIEAELDQRGKLQELHKAVERLTKKPWAEIQNNLNFYARPLYQAASEVATEVFHTPEEVLQALKNAESGELYNVQFFIHTVLDDLRATEKKEGKSCRLVLVLDESGQWIEDDKGRLGQLQALIEEAAVAGQGKIWVFVTTHEDMGSIYRNARALQGDMKKIEGRFRHKFNLTTENIELVLEDRLFKKNIAGKADTIRVYNDNPGVLRDMGQLTNTSQKLPDCTEDRFEKLYPFFPYQIHLVPEIVKSLRSAGGRGEQLSGSTRTLLAITQDILTMGRRNYLDAPVGDMVSFDEVYNNLAAGEVNPDVRRELSRVEEVVPGAAPITRRVAEVLFLIREIGYIPRTIDNLARLLVEHTTDDLVVLRNRILPELEKLRKAKLVARAGEEYEFLTGVRRTFEDEVSEIATQYKIQDLDAGLAKFVSGDGIGFQTVPFKGTEFPVRIFFDDSPVTKEGHIEVRVASPLAGGKIKLPEFENRSLRPDEQQTVFVLCESVPGFDEQIRYYLAMREVIDSWKNDPHKPEEAHKLATDRESVELDKLRRRVNEGLQDGLKYAFIIFRGASRSVSFKPEQTPSEALRADLAGYWPTLYPKFDRMPTRVINEQRAILDVLKGAKELTSDIRELKIFDKAGQLDPHSPLLDSIRVYLSGRQSRKERTLGHDLVDEFTKPPCGWDQGAIRVGVAALLRSGALKVLINKKPFTNPADSELQDALRVVRSFEKVELVIEETEVQADVLTEVRALMIKLTGNRKIDETPSAIFEKIQPFCADMLGQAARAALWAEPAGLPLPATFVEGRDVFGKILALTNPTHLVNEVYAHKDKLEAYAHAIRTLNSFVTTWGKAYTEIRSLAASLGAIDHRLPDGGNCRALLKNWQAAVDQHAIAQENTIKDLKNSKALAEQELQKLTGTWRDEARKTVTDALDRLPKEVAGVGLSDIQETLAVPMNTFLAGLDAESDVARVASLPERAARLVNEVAYAIKAEWEKRQTETPGGEKPIKPLKRVRMAEIASSVRIENEAQWNLVRDKLDQTVRKELAAGNDVELG